MNPEIINQRLAILPFRPFDITTTDGRRFRIPSPRACIASRDTVYLTEVVGTEEPSGPVRILDADHIVSIDPVSETAAA